MSDTVVSSNFGFVTGTVLGHKPIHASVATSNFLFTTGTVAGKKIPKGQTVNSFWGFAFQPINHSLIRLPGNTSTYYGRFHYWVEDIHGNILTKDLVVQESSIVKALSGPSQIQFKISPYNKESQLPSGLGPIMFKPWGHYIHAVKNDANEDEKIWASGLVQPSTVDPGSDVMTLQAKGFSCYPKGIPWLEDWNPLAVDPAEIIRRIWAHIQSYSNAQMGVTVEPTVTGTKMLPGFTFQQEEFVQNFFAIFIRAVDRNDCGDYIDKICRDIPIEYKEHAEFNKATGKIDKKILLGYPKIGTYQNGLILQVGDNVTKSTQKTETEINWLSDITMKGYFPGQEINATIANPDPDRLRRVMDEQDAHVDSQERAMAWAKKLLTKRQIPHYYEDLVIRPYHPNAPFMAYDVGDFIRVRGTMAWVGPVNLYHKVMLCGFDEGKGEVQLKMMAEGAFNYDPIEFVQPGATP